MHLYRNFKIQPVAGMLIKKVLIMFGNLLDLCPVVYCLFLLNFFLVTVIKSNTLQ